MAVRRLIALLCIFYYPHGLCEAQEKQARIYKDKKGKEMYLNALRCKLPEGSILYPIPDDYSKAFDTYTKREGGTSCCYGVKTRNDCCLDFEKDDKGEYNAICKCHPNNKCGAIVVEVSKGSAGSTVCPDDCKIKDKMCYKIEEGARSFDDAKSLCDDYRGKLMEQKDTKSIAAEILKDSKATDLWIGAMRKSKENNFKFLEDKVEKIELHKNFANPVLLGPRKDDQCVSMVKALD